MKNDLILNKISIIERCIKRIHEEYESNPKNLENFTKQDSVILNLQRACEASIALAMHIIALKKFEIPHNSLDAFLILEKEGILNSSLSLKMQTFVEFRNIYVDDRKINLEKLKNILDEHLIYFYEYTKTILMY
ncbi:DUF86 domain-containing protein [Cytobacillus pseudoceanisediminis]|uniref:type VII toxin-antitoxin system HepT family RNase toxin n=1 Tax=Cytobacillus pseudoceanisediminis TaxID=3051614 RepID=UPI003663C5F0